MHKVTNEKIGSVAMSGSSVTWKFFPGWSLLFDNPVEFSERWNIAAECPFYQAIDQVLDEIGKQHLFEHHGLCLTPLESYHATYWDGLNPKVLQEPEFRRKKELVRMLRSLGQRSSFPSRWLQRIEGAIKEANTILPISFVAGKFVESGRDGMYVSLQPKRQVDVDNLGHLEAVRAQLASWASDAWGWAYRHHLRPHVTVGYFANLLSGVAVTGELDHWNQILLKNTKGHSIEFDSISLYRFNDMASFWPFDAE